MKTFTFRLQAPCETVGGVMTAGSPPPTAVSWRGAAGPLYGGVGTLQLTQSISLPVTLCLALIDSPAPYEQSHLGYIGKIKGPSSTSGQ